MDTFLRRKTPNMSGIGYQYKPTRYLDCFFYEAPVDVSYCLLIWLFWYRL